MSDLGGEDALIQAMQIAGETALSEVNTTMPGKIVSVSDDGSRVVVKPSMPKALASGESLEAPQIVEVPVVWPRAQNGAVGMTMPLRPGDGVALHFAQRSLEGWLSGQSDTVPDDPRRFDLSDAVAVPGLAPSGTTAHVDEAQFFFGPVKLRMLPDGTGILETQSGKLTIQPDGVAAFTGPKVTISGNLEVHGNIVSQGDVTAGTISLRSHRHINSGGNGTGGTPI
jgi:hypothetical protein